jgi:hypothetical protein
MLKDKNKKQKINRKKYESTRLTCKLYDYGYREILEPCSIKKLNFQSI